MAVQHALHVLHWQENLSTDEMPPEWMWPFNDALDEWFDEVDARRRDRVGGRDTYEDAPDMMSNELARERK